MATLVLDVVTKAYPDITNRIRTALFLETAPLAVVAQIIDTTAGHPSRVWHFPGLYRNNYKISIDEIDGGGTVLDNIALFDAVPSDIETLLCRPDEQIEVDVTEGLVTGATSFVFDGTDGKPDYRGWSIVPSELNGRGILIKDVVDYTWDKLTGKFQLLLEDDKFRPGQFYNIHFDPENQTAGNSYPTLRDFSIKLITNTISLDSSYFDGKLIVEPATQFITVSLPDINTVVVGRPMMVEVSAETICCVQFVPIMGQTLKFLRGNLYALPNESFWIYRYQREDLSNEWRVSECDGNFKTVGQETSDDFTQDDVINKILLDGAIISSLQYARLYNEFVLNLPPEQVVNYDEWPTGNNKLLYSKANAGDPGFVNKFHIPDRRGLFEKNTDGNKAGDFTDQEYIKDYIHTTGFPNPNGVGTGLGYQGAPPSPNEFMEEHVVEGDTIQPKNYSINKYVLC